MVAPPKSISLAPCSPAVSLQHGQLSGGRVFLGLWHGKPGLQAKHGKRRLAHLAINALGMGDPLPCRHQIDLDRKDIGIGAQRIAVMQMALPQIGEPDLGMQAHVDPLPRQKFRRAKLIKKDEGADHLALNRWQGAAHLESRQIAGDDYGFTGIDLIADGNCKIKKRVPACIVSICSSKLGDEKAVKP